ncbi:MAG: SPOR domain-containing protein [Bacteroidota bacterium]
MFIDTIRRYAILLLAVFAFGAAAPIHAQDQLFTVQVGLFQDVSLEDFSSLKNLGFIYAQEVESNVHQVYIGNFSSRAKAQAVVDRLQERNFRNAVLLEQPLSAGSDIAVVQLASQGLNSDLKWAELEKAGTLYVQSDDQSLKVMTGVYPSRDQAQADVKRIRGLGYSDAFVKIINNYRLVPITEWETGVKKPLIPLNIDNNPPVAQSNTAPAPTTFNNTVTIGGGESTVGTFSGNATTNAALPNIRGNLKRQSVIELQRMLKAKNYYQGALDGYYGPGTTAAYNTAWTSLPGVQKYRRLSQDEVSTDFLSWPETKLLHTVANDLSAGQVDAQVSSTADSDRVKYFSASQPVSTATARRAQEWETTLWTRLDAWATTDPLHVRSVDALKLAYYQTLVRTEDYFMNNGFTSEQAKNLAIVSLQSIVGAELQRFL